MTDDWKQAAERDIRLSYSDAHFSNFMLRHQLVAANERIAELERQLEHERRKVNGNGAQS